MNNTAVAMEEMSDNKTMDMDGQMPHAKGNTAVDKLIDATTFTHTAVKSGLWTDPATWANGKVPDGGAKVLVAEGANVIYNQVSDERIETVAIEGDLTFAANSDTKLYVETIINAPEGTLTVGNEQQSVAADSRAQIIFTSDRAVDRSWDPKQLSKGLVSHGKVSIQGAEKQEKVTLVGDAEAGDDTLTFREDLSGWQVGDRIVLGGTKTNIQGKDADNSRFQDEVLTITEINGKQVKFTNDDVTSGDNNVLRFDHLRSTQVDANDLSLYAANLSRNVTFETENGKDVPLNRRGHVMLMHNPDVTVMNAGFYDLGRSDKSQIVDDVGENFNGTQGKGNNIRGRYGLHLHRTGANSAPAILRGNVVSGSPGWGIVQHDSNAGLEDNVVFDVVGSGIVAESGNEQGWWTDNLVVKTTGIPLGKANQDRPRREQAFDHGSEGDGYWIEGAAQIKNKDNKSISANRAGVTLFGSALVNENAPRDKETILVKDLDPKLQSLFPADQTEVDIRDLPMADITGFESYNADTGIKVWGHMSNFEGDQTFSSKSVKSAHEGRSLIQDFKLWGNRGPGAMVEYSSNVDLKDGVVISQYAENPNHKGLFTNSAAIDNTFDNITVSGFEQGAEIATLNDRLEDGIQYTPTITNSRFINNTYNLNKIGDFDSGDGRADDFSANIKLANNQFEKVEGNQAPTPKFSSEAIGGLSLELDASESTDADPLLPGDIKRTPTTSKGISAYQWDFDSNGTIDGFGREIKHTFDRAGAREVSLTVLDAQGEAATTKQTINIQPSAYDNAFLYGGFDADTETIPLSNSSSPAAGKGWFTGNRDILTSEYAKLSQVNNAGKILGQVVNNQKIHKGQQTLSFDLKNTEGNPAEKNSIEIVLWGINGQFEYDPDATENAGPQQVGTLPMERKALVTQTLGGEESFDWKNVSLDADLGNGYDYLLFQVSTSGTRNAGDFVAIDNISLAGEANAIAGGASNPAIPPQSEREVPVVKTPIVETPAAEIPVVESPVVESPVVESPVEQPIPKQSEDPVDPAVPEPAISDPDVSETPSSSLPSPIAQLSFEEGTGTLARDTSANGQNNIARLSQDASWTDGKVGQAIALNGRSDLAFRDSADINRETQPARTVSLWFKADDVAVAGKQTLFEEGSGDRGLNAYIDGGQLYFGNWDKSVSPEFGQDDWGKADISSSSNQWHHLAIVLDAEDTIRQNALTAYFDGDSIGSVAGSQLVAHDRLSLGNVNQTTRFHDGAASGSGHGLVGAIDELTVFNSALTESQVKSLAA